MIHGPHRLDRHDSDQGCKLGSLCIRFSSDVILGLRKETGYRPGWRSGRHGAEDWSLCSSYKAQPAPEGHLLVPDFYRFTLKYESSRCWQPLWNDLESFHGIYICICYNVVRARATGCHFVPIVSVCNTADDKHLKLRIWKLINSDMWTRQKRLLWRRSAVDQRLYRPVQATNAHTEKEA